MTPDPYLYDTFFHLDRSQVLPSSPSRAPRVCRTPKTAAARRGRPLWAIRWCQQAKQQQQKPQGSWRRPRPWFWLCRSKWSSSRRRCKACRSFTQHSTWCWLPAAAAAASQAAAGPARCAAAGAATPTRAAHTARPGTCTRTPAAAAAAGTTGGPVSAAGVSAEWRDVQVVGAAPFDAVRPTCECVTCTAAAAVLRRAATAVLASNPVCRKHAASSAGTSMCLHAASAICSRACLACGTPPPSKCMYPHV